EARGARVRASAIIDGDASNPRTRNPAYVSARASTPLPHPASTIRPRGGRCATRWGATSREKSLKPASWMCARSAEYITRIIRADVARSDGVVPVADSRRYRLRAVRLREETR